MNGPIFTAHITLDVPNSGHALTAFHSIKANCPEQAETIARFQIEKLLRDGTTYRGSKVVRIDIVPNEQLPMSALWKMRCRSNR